jgi:putative transposase
MAPPLAVALIASLGELHALSAHDQINNLFHLRRDHVTAGEHRASRSQTFQVWAEICSIGCR